MDVQMPEMDGLEATKLIHSRWPTGGHPYIVAMTANAMDGDRETYLAAGMDDYVSKPIRVEELVASLKRGAASQIDTLAVPPAEVIIHSAGEDIPATADYLDPAALQNLNELIGGEAAFLTELIETFLQDAPKLIADMDQAVTKENAAALHLAAHSLKSNSADFGAILLSTLCKELEQMGRNKSLAGAAALMPQLYHEYHRTEAALNKLRDDIKPDPI
jgi:CheY-like chemotaxis protein